MVPFDVVTSCFDVISNCRRVIMFQKGLEMFRFPVVKSSLRFPNVKIAIVSTLLLMLKSFFKTPGASNPSWHTRTDSTDHNYPKSFTKLVAGTARIFTLGKRSEDLTTGTRSISRPFWNMITLLQLLITLKQLVTSSNGTILTLWHPARLTNTVKLRRPCLFKSYSQHWMPRSAVKSFYSIKEAFSLG